MNSNKSILVSVVMPIYNAEKYLKCAIESILLQTHSNLELNIIYDSSTDNSLNIIYEFMANDKRIKLFKGNRKGITSALDIGIKHSKGKFIARMDGDDISDINRLEKQINHLENFKLDICGGHSLLIDNNNKINGISVSPLNHFSCTLCMGFEVPFLHSSVMIRKEFLKKNGLNYSQTLYKTCEDHDLWIRMHEAGGVFGNVDEIILRYRVLDNSLSRNNHLMLLEGRLIANYFFKKHYVKILNSLSDLAKFGNSTEKSLIVRFIVRCCLKKGNFLTIKYFKNIEFKTCFLASLSEILKIFRLRG